MSRRLSVPKFQSTSSLYEGIGKQFKNRKETLDIDSSNINTLIKNHKTILHFIDEHGEDSMVPILAGLIGLFDSYHDFGRLVPDKIGKFNISGKYQPRSQSNAGQNKTGIAKVVVTHK